MFRAGGITIAATLLVAAIPIPKPNPSVTIENQRPLQSVEHQTPSDAAHDNGGDKPAALPEKQTYIENPHGNEDTDIRPQWGIVGREVIETISIAVTALFTVFLALWTNGLRAETKKLVAGADDQAKKLADAISAMNALATETRNLVTEAGNQVTEMHSLAVAAARSATTAERALTELERPFIVAEVKITASQGSVPSYQNGQIRSRTIGFGPATISIENFGRTPAILTSIQYEFAPAPTNTIALPDNPAIFRGRELPSGTISALRRPYQETENLSMRFDVPQKIEFGEGRQTLWAVGFVRYQDIFRQNFIVGFALAFDPIGGRFVRRGDADYNYYREEEAADIPA